MKKLFFLKLICFLMAVLLIPVGYFVYVQRLPAMFRGSLMGSVAIKQEILQQTQGPRILLVGGSSVPYSIECETLSQEAGIPCISLGATAYLGLEYYFSLLDGELHQGDIVIIAPEFAMWQNNVSYSTTWMAVENSPSLLAKLPLSYIPNMISNYYSYSQKKLDLFHTQGAPTQTPLEQYTAFGFGKWGDIVTPRETLLESGYDKNNILSLDDNSLSPKVVKSVQDFAHKAEKAGASVYLTWAPFDSLAYTGTIEEMEVFEKQVKAQLDIPYLGKLTDCLLPPELFYDSNNHLTSEGASLRTKLLIRDCYAMGVF